MTMNFDFDFTITEIATVLLVLVFAVSIITLWLIYIVRFVRRSRQPPILASNPSIDPRSCTNDAFDCIDETSAKKIEERRRARQQALQNSPRADLTLRKIDPEIGKALAVEQLMRDSLVFDTLPRPPKGDVEIVAAKRDYL